MLCSEKKRAVQTYFESREFARNSDRASQPKISTARFLPSNPSLNPRSPPPPHSTTSAFPHSASIFAYKPPIGVPSHLFPIPIYRRSSTVFPSTLPTGHPPLAASLLPPLQQPPASRMPRFVSSFVNKSGDEQN
jgi:hypothetical protein